MKKNLLKSLLALALVSFGCMNVAAQNEVATGPVKMTYVSGSDADVDVAYGECDTIKAGWNHGNAVAVGTTIPLGNKNWGANWIGVLKVDLSAIPGTVQKATLKAMVSGSLDSKRNTGWGVALTDNEWSTELTYTTVSTWTVSAMLNGGVQVWTTSRSATGFEEISLDITDAFSAGQSSATLLVYEGIKDGNGGAAGGCMTEAVVEVEYEPFEATSKKYDFEDGVNPFTDRSRVTGAIEADATLSSNVLGWTCAGNAQNGYCFSDFNFTELLNQPALVKVEFDYYNTKGARSIMTIGDAQVRGTTGGSSKVTYNSTGAIFYIGSDKNNAFINGVNYGQDDRENTYKIFNEESPEDSIEVTETIPGLCDKWMHVTLMVNNDAKTVTWVITDMEGNGMYYGSDPFFAADANSCTQIDMFGYINNSHCAMIDNLEITNYKSNAQFADYTIRYVDANGTDIKESRTGNGQVGKFVKLLDSDKAAIVTDDMKYIYDSDDSETVAIAEEGTVITVTFRDAEKYYAVLNCCIDGQTMATGKLEQFRDNDKYWFWEGDDFSIRPAIAYVKDGKYYTVQPDSYNGKVFTFPGSVAPAVNGGKTYYIGTLYYTLDETIAYHSDFERLALPTEDAGDGTGLGQLEGTVNNWWSFSNGYFDRFSQGRGIRLDNGSYVWTEPIAEEGTYMVRIYGRNDKSANCEAPYALGLRDAEGNVTLLDVAVPDWASATTGENVVGNAAVEAQDPTDENPDGVEAKDAAGIGIPAGYSLVVKNTGNGDMISLDDIRLIKVGDYTETPVQAPVYTVAGTEDLTGYDWDPAQNVMTLNAESGLYEWTAENITVTANQQPEFKVVKDGTTWYPDNNWVITAEYVGGAGVYTITITFNAETTEIGVIPTKTGDIVIPAQDIHITPESGADIAVALTAAEEGIENIGDIYVELAQNGQYTISGTLTAPHNFYLWGNDATIDASALEAPMTALTTIEEPTEWTTIDHFEIKGVTVKGLKKALFYSNSKNYRIDALDVDWANVEVAADVTVFDFTKGSAANLNVTNSTFYAPTETTKAFYSSQAAQKMTEAGEYTQTFNFSNNTMYNLAKAKNFFSHRQNNQTWLIYNVQNNLFVNCGKSGQTIKGMNGGASGSNPTWTIIGNAFNFDGADTSAAESTGDDAEPVQDSVAGVVEFTDAANGDFNGEFTLAEGATAPQSLGAPMWTITFSTPEPEAKLYVIGNENNWDRTNLIELKFDESANAYTYSINTESDFYFAFATYQMTSEEADADSNWDVFNNNYRYSIGEGDQTVTLDTEYQLVKVNGTIKLTAGKYIVSVTKDFKMTIKDATATGINAVAAEKAATVIFNLKGQRVTNAQKGMYIINGKKVVK